MKKIGTWCLSRFESRLLPFNIERKKNIRVSWCWSQFSYFLDIGTVFQNSISIHFHFVIVSAWFILFFFPSLILNHNDVFDVISLVLYILGFFFIECRWRTCCLNSFLWLIHIRYFSYVFVRSYFVFVVSLFTWEMKFGNLLHGSEFFSVLWFMPLLLILSLKLNSKSVCVLFMIFSLVLFDWF